AVALSLLAGGVGGVVGGALSDDKSASSSSASDSSSDSGAPARAPSGSIESVAQKVLPSVVMIKVQGNEREGEGSGEIIDAKNGYILTNNHVASGAGRGAKMSVVFSDGTTAPATLVGGDSVYDIAVIKVTGKNDLKQASFGSSKNLQVGQQVVAIGSPLGLAGTVTTGIVSSLNRPVATNPTAGDRAGSVIDAIQTDAAINPGNSGGALADMNGNIVGINTAIASLGGGPDQQSGSIGLGFAIPIDQAKRIAEQLIKFGKAVHPVIGIEVRSDQDIDDGALVVRLTQDGPAAKVGIPVDSVVTKLNSRIIDSSNALIAAVRSYMPGEKVTLTYREPNNGPTKTVEVTLASSDGGR
ncbi:MAG: PDZ domain-containing protein, partial [Mycobacteriaceae bacterium]|nr:PDZ domain-containing protein [Mycobacteriaceae bacterium]